MNHLLKTYTLLFMVLCVSVTARGQDGFPYPGVDDTRPNHIFISNANIHISFDKKIENASIIIKNGRIDAIGTGLNKPETARAFDAQGMNIYPSFVELYSDYGLKKDKSKKPSSNSWYSSTPDVDPKGAFGWNTSIKPQTAAHNDFHIDEKVAGALRSHGFGTVLTHHTDGIARGTGALVTLSEKNSQTALLKERTGHFFSFDKGDSGMAYPRSLMGCIALLKQTYLDAQWYAQEGYKKETNLSLEAWNQNMNLTQFFVANDKLNILRAQNIAKTFGQEYIYVGGGDEYMRINELKSTGARFIIPVNYPAAMDVEDPYDAEIVDYSDMLHWELAKTNAARLNQAGIEFAFTSNKIEKGDNMINQVAKSVQAGLSKEMALKALTEIPARMAGAFDQVGSLEVGKWANFLIIDGDLFEKGTLVSNWVQGEEHAVNPQTEQPELGDYTLDVGTESYILRISEGRMGLDFKLIINDSSSVKVKQSTSMNRISLSYSPEDSNDKVRLSGFWTAEKMSGRGQLVSGDWVNWEASLQNKKTESEARGKKGERTASKVDQPVVYPFMAFGNKDLPTAKTYLIQNATVWTNEADGILEQTDVLVKDGMIKKIGKNLKAGDAIIIDGTNKHLTAGIVDEHTHIAATRGINEGTQASSAEVSVQEVVNSEDIDIYRQLAGGVTTAQILHGSANPIGGQSALIKLKWGYAPDEMLYPNADPFIKFALGENVKQSWNRQGSRYPRTRMGVEQVYENYFTKALEYGKLKESGQPYRKDLELEALLEILNSKRFITCHSYQQGEINMLMKLADRYGFTVNTFTHILEGYKVADKMADHGAGGSSFSDWWAYKYEVIDAIPYNGKLMHDQGIVVAFNSDDAEMARRLNQEAGKAVMYGGMSQEEALKFVTLNPAKLLHIDDKVGSVKAGKHADLVLWSANPLSIYAKAEITMIEGAVFFDRSADLKAREELKSERSRLIQLMLNEKSSGGKMRRPQGRKKHHYHCDHEEDEGRG
jgi:imidazolonepropionase-like amidohydrolase